MKKLSYSIQNENKISKNKSDSFAQIITGLTILTNSLDFEKGEPIASNLFNLYDYCKREIIQSYKSLKMTVLKSVWKLLKSCCQLGKKLHNFS